MKKELFRYRARVMKVVDGDTLDLGVDLGFNVVAKIRVRLLGVDTPEVHGVKHASEEYKKGKEASEFTSFWCGHTHDEVFVVTHKGKGKYGRWLAEVFPVQFVNEDKEWEDWEYTTTEVMSLNEALIQGGHAVKYDGGKR